MPEATSGLGRSKLRTPAPQRKIDVKRELSVDSVSVFTLIRTDTTLDLSQKAEKGERRRAEHDAEVGAVP